MLNVFIQKEDKFLKCFDALSKDSSIFGNRFLEASAGTGKTFAIEHVFLRLLLESKNEDNITIENILVVTFTKAATRELKYRIRSNIEKALTFLKSENRSILSSFNYLLPFLDNKKESINKLQSALLLFDSAQIFTIHGFCYFMLTKYPFESDTIFNLSEESAYKEIVKKECLDFLRYFAGSGRYFPEQISILLQSYQEISPFIEKLINFNAPFKKELLADEILMEFNTILQSQLPSYDDLNNGPATFRQKILEDFEKLKNFYKKITYLSEEEIIEQLDLLISLFEQGACSFELFNEILKTKFTLFDFFNLSNRKIKYREESEESLKLNYPGFFTRSSSLLYPLIKEALDGKKILNNLALDIHTKAKERLIEEDLFTYDDLIIKMNEALDSEIFRKNVQKNFKGAIVDEFQDTDPLQWEILKKIFFKEKLDLKAFYLVGDPKQSIYSFRHADLATYFSAGQFLGEGSKFFLNTNYRSLPELVSSLNYLLSDKFLANWINIPKMNLSYSYTPVLAGVEKDDNFNEKNPVEFFIAQDCSSKNKKWPSNNLENEIFFPYILNEILRLNKDQGIKFENIAILVKDRFQAESIKRFLLKKAVPAHSSSDKPIYETKAFEGLKEILEATINCKDINHIKVALAGPYIKWTDRDIIEKNIDEPLILFCNLNEILKTKGPSHFFRSFLYSSFSDESSIYEKLINKNDLSFYQNTIQLIELIIEKDREQKLTSEGILNFFVDLKTLYGEDNPRLMTSASSDLDSVQIMTIHMSKGLEFDVVFALGACNRKAQEENIEEINLEKFRQLYVALTRAKKRLYVPFIIDENEKGYEESSFSPMELFFQFSAKDGSLINNDLILSKINFLQCEGIIKAVFLKGKAEKIIFPSSNENIEFDLLPKINLIKDHGLIHSFSSLSSKGKTFHSIKEEINSEILFSSLNIAPGSEAGIIIHKIFERIFSGKEKNFWTKEYLSKIIEEELSYSMFLGKQNYFIEIISLALQLPLADLNFAIKDVFIENIFVETEFLFSYKDEKNLMKGFVDLVLCYEGKYYLIDWKTNWLGDEYKNYSKENLLVAMHEHEYFLQAAIYSESLKRYLKIIDSRPFDEIFGGAVYIFLRGLHDDDSKNCGIYHFIPDLSLLSF